MHLSQLCSEQKDRFINSFHSHFNGKSKFNIVLDLATYILYGLAMFSIPTCSFISGLNIVTWVFTIGFLGCMALGCILYYNFKLDIISAGLILFCVSAIISTALNGWVSFLITPIALALCTCLIYIYCKGNNVQNVLIKCAYYGIIIFLFTYIFKYWNELIHFNFERLGGLFGDENDVAIILSLGMCLAGYYAFFSKKVLFIILNVLLILLFGYCGLSTGSKTFILLGLFAFIFLTIIKCGKKKWWLSLLIIVGGLSLGIILIWFVPFLSTIKVRIIDMLNEIFNCNLPGGSSVVDYSTKDRFSMFLNGMSMFLRKPMFGWGISGFATFAGFNNGWSHNNISETFCNFGLIGTILFHLGFFYSFKGYKKISNKNKRIFLMILIFFIVCMLSVALNSQKIYAYTIPLVFSYLCKCTDIVNIKTSTLIKKKEITCNENC